MHWPRIAHRHKALFIALGAILLILIGGVAGLVMLLSGAYSTAATKQHFAITYRLLEAGLHFSVLQHAKTVVTPKLDDPAMIGQGAACYREHCVQCHGAPGMARDDLGKGMLPGPSSLPQSARDWPASHLYYVTKKGVRMAGMPAWEFRMSEQALWATVAYLKAMPFMTKEQSLTLTAANENQACPRASTVAPYSQERAKTTLRQYACDNCHIMDGVVGAHTYVGPPLTNWSQRKYIAGVIPNTRENLIRWIVDPEGVSPGTLMPDLEVTEVHAAEMADFLLGRKDGEPPRENQAVTTAAVSR